MHQVGIWIVGFVVGCLAVGILALGIPVPFRLVLIGIRRRNKFTTTMAVVIFTRKLIKRPDDLSFLEKEDTVSSLAVIGRGGCGEVFKAQLPVEGESEEPKFIAIKKIKKQVVNEGSRQLDNWSPQMQSEIRTVGYIRHRNLLLLAAHVHVQRPECHYLVYEYMKNGSLKNALMARPQAGEEEGSGGGARLPWPARLRVAMGIASGLEYLHVLQQPQIIHRDLKTDNILLDDDMEARIADFGLAKAMPDAHTHVSSLHVAGTVGYIAPEYFQTRKFTVKCDIFSFGVILAVLATGKEPGDLFFATEENADGLVSWVHRMVQCGDYSDIDLAIAGAGHDEQIRLLLRIAMFCTARDPKERPSAKEARFMLAQINNP